jgi:hypothetical protein
MSVPATQHSMQANLPSLESISALFQGKKPAHPVSEPAAPAQPPTQQANVPQVDATINTLSQGIFSTLAKIFAIVVIAAYLFSDPQGSPLDRKIGQSLNGLVTGAAPVVTHWNEINTSVSDTIQATGNLYTSAKRTVDLVSPIIPALQSLSHIFSAPTAHRVTA